MTGIVLTTDLSPESQRAFAPTMALARLLGKQVTLLAVVEDLAFEVVASGGLMTTYPDRAQLVHDFERRLAELAATVGKDVRWQVIEGHDIAIQIVEFASGAKADFISMASHGRRGIRRMLLGSVVEDVLRRSHIPVIVFPPPVS
ncbi:MAG TPA: universal stress protein [Planctomycetota bacterium]|nr:universal stress protein [Planctomycetota bacterium]